MNDMLGIGDYDKVNRRKVKTREDQILFNGRKYRMDSGTGYYLCTTGKRERLHVKVWEAAHGRVVPPGCVIHHIDWDKRNNNVGNLICLTVGEHNEVHNPPGGNETATSRRVLELTEQLISSRVDGLPPNVI